ncbi:MAG: hypothetical protein IKT27_00255 [Clostridia bacterium]|nr:hypothetical protein [Clostridia bacterium]
MEEKKKINWKKIGLNLIYPHLAVIICLLPISVVFLILSLIYLGTESILAIVSYLLSFYVLLVICFRMPKIIKFFKNFKKENKYMQKWFSDVHLRMNVSLYGSLIWNTAFGLFQLGLGFYHNSFWFYSMFAYYVMLGVMRFFLVKHTRKYKANEQTEIEMRKYVLSGWLLLFMNLALAVIVFFIVYWNKTFNHHMITTIALATYTFLTFTFAIVNIVRYKKYKSPVYSAAKNISLIAGSVSMLTLETTMLTTFGTNENPLFNQIILSLTGVAVIGFAITMAIIMITKGTKNLKEAKNLARKN